MKLGKLIQIRKILEEHSQEKIPAQTAYKIMKVLKTTEEEQLFYNDKLGDLINEFALKDDDGNAKFNDGNIQIAPSKTKEWNSAIAELMNTDVNDVNIRLELYDLTSFQATVKEMSLLDELIKTE